MKTAATTDRSTSLSAADHARFSALVRQASGIEVPEIRRAALENAVAQALAASGTDSLDELAGLLASESGRPQLERLVEALTIGETHFFRNEPQFKALTETILPEIIARRRAERRLRIWSAGCSTGEEAYSLAIALESLLPNIDQWNLHLLATDINRQSLLRAQAGVYSPWSFR